jgi:hypothetical protein
MSLQERMWIIDPPRPDVVIHTSEARCGPATFRLVYGGMISRFEILSVSINGAEIDPDQRARLARLLRERPIQYVSFPRCLGQRDGERGVQVRFSVPPADNRGLVLDFIDYDLLPRAQQQRSNPN